MSLALPAGLTGPAAGQAHDAEMQNCDAFSLAGGAVAAELHC